MPGMHPVARAVFGVFAFLPLLGVTAIATALSSARWDARAASPEQLLHDPLVLGSLAGVVAIALLQIALAAVVAIHVASRRDLEGGEKVAWALACLLVGSIALPLFFLLKTKPRA